MRLIDLSRDLRRPTTPLLPEYNGSHFARESAHSLCKFKNVDKCLFLCDYLAHDQAPTHHRATNYLGAAGRLRNTVAAFSLQPTADRQSPTRSANLAAA